MTHTEDLLLRDLLEGPADEIYDIPEFEDEDKFDVEGYINGNIDYWLSWTSKSSNNANN